MASGGSGSFATVSRAGSPLPALRSTAPDGAQRSARPTVHLWMHGTAPSDGDVDCQCSSLLSNLTAC